MQIRWTFRLAVLLLLTVPGPVLMAQKAVRVELREVPGEKKVEVYAGGQFFTAFFQPEGVKKPVLWPLVSPGGHEMTRGFPLQPREGERVDHPHQVGVWFNFGDVNGLDFWNHSEAIPAEKRDQYGTILFRSIDRIVNGRKAAELEVTSAWVDSRGSTLLNEKTTFRFLASDQLRIIDRTTTLTAVGGEVLFTDNKEGLIAVRVARELELPARGEAEVIGPGGQKVRIPAESRSGISGNYLSSEGLSGEKVWGTRGRWMELTGTIGDEEVALILIDHPNNPGYPAHWHARGYGLFSANNMGQKAFSADEEPFTLQLSQGKPVTFRYRMVVATGPLTPAQIGRMMNNFICCRNSKLFSKEW